MTKNLADELQFTARQAMTGLHPLPQGEEPGGLPLRKLLAAVFRSRYLVFGTTLFGLLVGAFLAITTANSYVSTGTFRFTGSGAEVSDIDPTRATQTSLEAIGTTATYILGTPGLLSRVVDRLGPARILAPYRPGTPGASGVRSFFYAIQRDWNATRSEDVSPEEALKCLQRTLSIERPRFTDVLVATCRANDPRLAQEVLSVYMAEAIKWHIEKYDDPKAYEELRKAVDDARQRLDAAQRALQDFRDLEAGVQDFESELRRLREDESDALGDRTRHEAELSQKRAMVEALREQLDQVKGTLPRYVIEHKKPDPTREIDEYTARKIDLNLELKRLQSEGRRDTADKERQIQAIDAEIARIKKQAAEAEPIPEQVENPDWRRATVTLGELQTEVRLLAAQLAQMTKDRETASKRLERMIGLEPQYLKLRDARLAADDALKLSLDAWQVAQQKRALSQGLFSSLKEVEPASLPLEKEGPNRGRLLLGGLMVGLFLGLGLVVLRALPDTVVRTRENLERIEGLQVIGVMPRLDGRNLKRHRLLRERGW